MYHTEKVIAALNCSYVKFTICITNYHTQGPCTQTLDHVVVVHILI
jgi:hypothetical protein